VCLVNTQSLTYGDEHRCEWTLQRQTSRTDSVQLLVLHTCPGAQSPAVFWEPSPATSPLLLMARSMLTVARHQPAPKPQTLTTALWLHRRAPTPLPMERVPPLAKGLCNSLASNSIETHQQPEAHSRQVRTPGMVRHRPRPLHIALSQWSLSTHSGSTCSQGRREMESVLEGRSPALCTTEKSSNQRVTCPSSSLKDMSPWRDQLLVSDWL
jgi:hypothetical protein